MDHRGRGTRQLRTRVRGALIALLALLAIGVSVEAGSAAAVSASPQGYLLAGTDGGVFAFGRTFRGSAAGLHLRAPIVGIASTVGDGGYWLVGADGGVFAFGNARFFGSLGGLALNGSIVGIAATPDGGGYWLVGADGGVFAFGNARFFGSLSGAHVLAPFVGIASTGDGGGYRMLTESGEVFSFGDALAPGDPPAVQAPTGHYVAMTRLLSSDRGVVLATRDGRLTAFDAGAATCAPFPANPPTMNAPLVGITAASAGCAQWTAGSDGGVFSFGGPPFLGSAATFALTAPIVGIAG
jgi:hypothetical protein